MTFLAPLDNLLWDRKMIQDIFDFAYRWEVYTPLKKRKYGYYVLPILYGDTFVGRIEPVLNKDKKLEVRGLWQEKTIAWDKKTQRAYTSALEKFRKYSEGLSTNVIKGFLN